jgi:hypothetical protein
MSLAANPAHNAKIACCIENAKIACCIENAKIACCIENPIASRAHVPLGRHPCILISHTALIKWFWKFNSMVSESQLLHKIVNLLFQLVN